MENNFKLKEIINNSSEFDNAVENEYILGFTSSEELKTISLVGKGKIKETATV